MQALNEGLGQDMIELKDDSYAGRCFGLCLKILVSNLKQQFTERNKL